MSERRRLTISEEGRAPTSRSPRTPFQDSRQGRIGRLEIADHHPARLRVVLSGEDLLVEIFSVAGGQRLTFE
jgi:hypothetical protein